MTSVQISAAARSILNLSYYDCQLRVPGGNLKYKIQSLIAADRFFDLASGNQKAKGELQWN
jgi:hypothetical protein